MSTKSRSQKDYPQDAIELEQEFNISDQDLERAYRQFIAKEKPKKKNKGLRGAASVFGGVMLVVTFMMMLQMVGIPAGPDINFTNHILLPVIAALFVLLGWTGLKRKLDKRSEEKFDEPLLKVKTGGRNTDARQTDAFEELEQEQKQKQKRENFRDFQANSFSGNTYAERVANAARAKKQRNDTYAFTRKKTIYRSRTDKKIMGVCGGIAEYLNVDPTLVRIIFALSVAFYGTTFFLYLALGFILRKEPVD
ncbi:MAG: PspC domain-containing protein [Candidatus Cyclonatronum sp.]|uniref:PspC domain-containing protein n=1 Tax=Cyclonatronum sp. TaxID=3024185 RepID=UPI0025C5223C|nr:PspC domain-containing protein [Cyclonatronum sp.]MCH8487604.1 PspC domain-containing protein [Cyclonatronum sp.]